MELSEAFEMLIVAALQGDVVKTNQWAMYIRSFYTLDAITAFLSSTFGSHKSRAMSHLTGTLVALAPAPPHTPWRKS